MRGLVDYLIKRGPRTLAVKFTRWLSGSVTETVPPGFGETILLRIHSNLFLTPESSVSGIVLDSRR